MADRHKNDVHVLTTTPADDIIGAEDSNRRSAGAFDIAAALRIEVAARVATGKVDLPLLPQIASQVVMLAGNPNVDAAQVSDTIHRDPALAGQVLRIANSPAYMPRMPIVSLQQAVARLGLGLVTEIAFAASLQSGTFRVPGYEAELKVLWRHAIASAAFAKEIARLRRSNVESAFLCGLLHAVGKPALLQVVADVEQTLLRASPRAQVPGTWVGAGRAALPLLLEELHTVVGSRIAELWALPRQVAISVAYYAQYDQAPAFLQEAMITCLADRLATDLTEPGRFDDTRLRKHTVFSHLNLYPDDVDSLLSKRARIADVVASMTA